MAGLQIDDAGVKTLVDKFYERVRADPELGPVFNDAIHDWPDHLSRLTDFWHSVMLTSGRYKGQPVPVHMKHRERITPELFGRWLALWATTTNELMEPAAALALQDRAGRIGESLQIALFYRPDRPWNLAKARPAQSLDTGV